MNIMSYSKTLERILNLMIGIGGVYMNYLMIVSTIENPSWIKIIVVLAMIVFIGLPCLASLVFWNR